LLSPKCHVTRIMHCVALSDWLFLLVISFNFFPCLFFVVLTH
jgi:hypothetical protein